MKKLKYQPQGVTSLKHHRRDLNHITSKKNLNSKILCQIWQNTNSLNRQLIEMALNVMISSLAKQGYWENDKFLS